LKVAVPTPNQNQDLNSQANDHVDIEEPPLLANFESKLHIEAPISSKRQA
jgi:hypothetical protein